MSQLSRNDMTGLAKLDCLVLWQPSSDIVASLLKVLLMADETGSAKKTPTA